MIYKSFNMSYYYHYTLHHTQCTAHYIKSECVCRTGSVTTTRAVQQPGTTQEISMLGPVSTNHSPVSRQSANQHAGSAAAANHGPGIPSHGSAEQNLLFIVITATKELREHRKFGLFPRHHAAVEGRGGDIPQCARLKSKAQ